MIKESSLCETAYTLLILAFGDEDEDRCRLGVGGAARVIARVRLHCLANRQPALSWFVSWIGLYGHAAARGVVVYHPVIVIPEHVLRRRRALEQIEEEWHRLTSMRFNARIFPSTKATTEESSGLRPVAFVMRNSFGEITRLCAGHHEQDFALLLYL